ncbi:MAG TPA: AMP-binding protein [Candidatus Methylomirabilis sp.]|nr:AMP-binding protein [Candidatus Methylomirabilis sp.]
MPAATLTGPERAGAEREVLDLVGGLVAELGGTPSRTAVTLDDSLDRDLGIGSLERVELLVRLEHAFGVRLPDAAMAEAVTPRDLLAAILTAEPSRAEPLAAVRAPVGAGAAAPASALTLMDVLAWHAGSTPDRIHIYLRAEDGREQPITYGALHERACAIAAGLRARGLGRGDTVALMLRSEQAFFDSFFGVLLAGAVPVPIYPPFRRDRVAEYAGRQINILDNAQARALITFPEAAPVAGLLRSRVSSLRHVLTASELAPSGTPVPVVRVTGDDSALIQYTSGSTGAPKGVLLSHANILANIRAIGEALAIGPEDVAVSWLPLYHDMGLIGSWLGALYFGIPIVVLSPLAFLSRPARWLQTLHTHRASLSAAPNFAFDLCVKRIADEELQGVDLSSWRLALNGSEPVSADTIDRFSRRFARFGFRRQAMCPVYGLAEASVALTIPTPGTGPHVDTIAREPFQQRGEASSASAEDPSCLRFVSCGRPLPRHHVRIVDRAGQPVGERREGRIEFRGPSVTSGYCRNEKATRATLHEGWMDSGDLGYWADGDLFVTGRQKDMIIKAGRNLYPQEVEEVVGAVPGIRKGCVAAFGVHDPAIGTERLVVIAESRETDPDKRAQLHADALDRIVAALGVPADTVVIAEPGSVFKTSSGKIRRSATKHAYVTGVLARRRPSAQAQWLRLLAGDVWARARRVAATLAIALYLTSILVLTLPALWLSILLAPTGRRADRMTRAWCRLVLALAGYDVSIEGEEHLNTAGPAVLAANHSSYLDVVVLLAGLPADFRFIAKRELLHTPLVGRVIRTVGHLTVERAAGSQSVADAERVTAALRRGVSVLVFPEGTFVRSPGILPFRLGAFKSAVETGCPVIPVTILGTREILTADDWLPRPGAVRLAVSPPIRADGHEWTDMVDLRDRVRTEIARRSGEPVVGTQIGRRPTPQPM